VNAKTQRRTAKTAKATDGYEQIIVIGRHRGSKRYETMIVNSEHVTNWRAKVVYAPVVLRRIHGAVAESWKRNWASQDEVEQYRALMLKRRAGGT